MAFAPLVTTALATVLLGAAAIGKGTVRSWPKWPVATAVLVSALVWMLLIRIGVGETLVSSSAIWRMFGLVALVVAGFVAARGASARTRADALLEAAPRPFDEVAAEVRRTGVPQWGCFAGRIGAEDQVTSPGGVVCAFFQTELRDGEGSLLNEDRGFAPLVQLKGENELAAVNFSPDALVAKVVARPCRYGGSPVLADGPALDGLPPSDAVSHEQVGKCGEKVLAVGQLKLGRNGFEVGGVRGRPALLVVDADCAKEGTTLAKQAWRAFSVAASLSVVAAWALARGF